MKFTQVPAAGEGSATVLTPIAGVVTGAKPGERIVLYAKAGPWWVQPFGDHPFTEIQPDGAWQSRTHPGVEYAALLVAANYEPPAKAATLPNQGGGIRAIAITRGGGPAALPPANILRFSGYEWEIRRQPSERGGSMNPYLPANAWVDAAGFLHLRTSRQQDQWAGAEVQLTHSLGYGTYRFTVQDISRLDPATAMTLYTRDEAAVDQNNREIDIEISRWGDPGTRNAQYVVPPFNEPNNVVRFTAPAGQLTYSFHWEPERLLFRTTKGPATVSQHEFTSNVPSPGGESARMNLYVYGNARTPARSASEVVIEKFEYLP